MVSLKFDHSTLELMSLFTKMTGVHPKDCFTDQREATVFVVEGNIAQVVGKGGANVRRLEQKLKRKIKILLFNPELKDFVANVVQPLKLHTVELEDDVVVVEAVDTKTRGMLIGRNASNLRNYEMIIKRYFPISELKAK